MIMRRIIILIVALAGIFYLFNFSLAATNHLVISEIQIDSINGAGGTEDDFVELYNPQEATASLTNWSIQKTSASGGSLYRKELSGTIPAHGFFLIVRNGGNTNQALKNSANILASDSSFSLSENNSIYLVNNNEDIADVNDPNIIDKVGWGNTVSFENQTTTNPLGGQSLERGPGGDFGNGNDADNNLNDFFIQNNPNPQNSSSTPRPTIIVLNNPPTAIITVATTTFYTNQLITFSGASSTDADGQITDYTWSFGDGATSIGTTTSYAYSAANDYNITLTVTDDNLATSNTSTVIHIIENTPPATTTTSTVSTTAPTINPGDILINEFFSWVPTTSVKEWVELYNATSSDIDLSGWTLTDNSSTSSLSGLITATGTDRFRVFEFNSGRLNNDGDIITIKNSTGQVINRVAYGAWDDGNKSDNAPTPGENYSTARTTDGLNSNNNKNDFCETITPTKGLANSITPRPNTSGGTTNHAQTTTTNSTTTASTTATTTLATTTINYQGLIINEIFPDPKTDEQNNEFIELKNTGTSTIDLHGFSLSDKTTRKYLISDKAASSTIVAPGGFLIVKKTQSKIALNNTGFESVRLFSPALVLIEQIDYLADSIEDKSYSRDNADDWFWVETPTPGVDNIITDSEKLAAAAIEDDSVSAPSQTAAAKKKATNKTTKVNNIVQQVTLEEARSLENNSRVKVRGVISVEPGVLGTQIFYLAGSGIQIYCNKKDFPPLKIGDFIELTGTLSETGGERRIKIIGQSDIKLIEHQNPPTPHIIGTNDINEDSEGSLVIVSGEVIEVRGKYLFLDDGSGETRVYLKAFASQGDLAIKPGDQLQITGIVSQTSAGYRLLPRSASDIIKVGEVKGASEIATATPNKSNNNALKYLIAAIIFLVAIISWLAYRHHLAKSIK
ncbi:MAG: lamin tail domain-containing protein [Patescibacteria group bacterium]